MYYNKIEIKKLLNCKKCEGILDQPKLLPCGKSICSLCVSSIKLNKIEYECLICNNKHEMPKSGLPINESLVEILSVKTVEISFFSLMKLKLKDAKTKAIYLLKEASKYTGALKKYLSFVFLFILLFQSLLSSRLFYYGNYIYFI